MVLFAFRRMHDVSMEKESIIFQPILSKLPANVYSRTIIFVAHFFIALFQELPTGRTDLFDLAISCWN